MTNASATSVLPGIWGGDRANLTIEGDRTQIRFDCGVATINGALKRRADGSFSAKGVFEDFADRPVDPDHPPKHRTAGFNGQFNGDMLDLAITISGEPQPRRYRLTKGRRVKLINCM
jgi:hypothetical protein